MNLAKETAMLVLCRKLDEGVNCGDRYRIMVSAVRRGAVQLTLVGLNEAGRAAMRSKPLDAGGRIWCREGGHIILDEDVTISAMVIKRSGTRLGVEAPASVRITRIDCAQPGAVQELEQRSRMLAGAAS